MEIRRLSNVTVEEYLKIEQETDTKYEYHNGEIFAMAGGTLNHGLICGNIFGEARQALKDTNCRVMNSEIKLYVKSQGCFLYPDTMMICGDLERSETELNAVTNPKVIVEVLSKSTAGYDRGDKFYFYRQIPMLQEYILIEQDKCSVEIYKRNAKSWDISRVTDLSSQLEIAALEIFIPLREIYRDVEFSS